MGGLITGKVPEGLIVLITVVIPAYNSSRTIEDCLVSIQNQTFDGRYEIVLVDNGSTDDTVAQACRIGVDKVVSSPGTTVYGARNEAVAEAEGDVLAFIDSDCVADPDWLSHGVGMLGGCDMVSGRILPQTSESPLLYNYDKYVARAHQERDGAEVSIAAGNAIMKRVVFDDVSGFNSALETAGDSIFSMQASKKGFVVKYAVECIVYHPVDGFKRRLRRLFQEGYGASLKAPIRYAGQSTLQIVRKRARNLFVQVGFELCLIEHARREKAIGAFMAFRLVVFSIFMKSLSYLAILSANYLKRLNQFLARR